MPNARGHLHVKNAAGKNSFIVLFDSDGAFDPAHTDVDSVIDLTNGFEWDGTVMKGKSNGHNLLLKLSCTIGAAIIREDGSPTTGNLTITLSTTTTTPPPPVSGVPVTYVDDGT
jgi:hypothetical protein